MRKKMVCLLVVVSCLTIFFGTAGSLGATLYRYQDLNDRGLTMLSSIKAINDNGFIVGYYWEGNPNFHRPFVWPLWGTLPLKTPDNTDGEAYGINKSNQIVGRAYTFPGPIKACLWANPLANVEGLYTSFESMVSGYAYGINAAGEPVGEGQFSVDGPTRAARWTNTHTTLADDLGTLGGNTSTARSINDAGQVVGTAQNSQGHYRACIWNPGQAAQDLAASLPDGNAAAINNQGNVVGAAEFTPGLGLGHAFFWDHQTGTAQDICPGDYESSPGGISGGNEVVGGGLTIDFGNFVFYWTPNGGKKDLNQLVVNLPNGVTLRSADAISPNGRYITGFDSQDHPYLLSRIVAQTGEYLLLLLD